MTQTITTLFAQDFAANQLNVLYNELLDTRIENGWELADTRYEMGEQYDRHTLMLANAHNIAVTMDWLQELVAKAFEFLTKDEGAKYVRNLYMARLAVDDLFVGAAYHELTIGTETGCNAVVEMLEMIVPQVQREVLGNLRKDGNYTIEEARALMADLWFFASAGLVGTKQDDLAYGADILVKDGRYQQPKALINTGDLADGLTTEATVAALEGLL